MKARRLLLMAIAVMLSVGVVSCAKDDENGNDSGGNTTAEWVDLGLPSGLWWASCNLGATKPEEYGDYYAWGETEPKNTYNESTYKYFMGDIDYLTKYCNNGDYGYNGYTDILTVLQAMDDAATTKLGSSARMPTKADWEELIANTTRDWTTLNGVFGRMFIASNGNSIFLPAAGGRDGSELYGAGSVGYYWSSSLHVDDPYSAWLFAFDSDILAVEDIIRCYGLSVRAVR